MNLEHCEQEGIHTGIRFPFPKDVTPEERAWFVKALAPLGRYDTHFSFSLNDDGELLKHNRSESTTYLAPLPTTKSLHEDVERIVNHLLVEGPHAPVYQHLEEADRLDIESKEIEQRIQEQRGRIGRCLHSYSAIHSLLNCMPFAQKPGTKMWQSVRQTLSNERYARVKQHSQEQRGRLQAFLDEHAQEIAQALRDTVAASARAKQQAEKYRHVPHLDIPLEEVGLRKIRIAGYPASVEYRQNSVMIYIQVAPRSTYAVLVHKGETVQLGEGDQRFSGVECSHPREGTLARLSASGKAKLEITLEEWNYHEPKWPQDRD